MDPIPYEEQYALLKSRGVAPLAAIVAMCRTNPDCVSWIEEWFARKNPDAGTFRDYWQKRKRAESREYGVWVGTVDEGCFQYFNISHRPGPTVFIKWDEVGSIYIQDGQHHLSLIMYSPGQYGGKFIQAQDDIPGFTSLVEEVSSRFFGKCNYLGSVFKRGGHPSGKFQVWPRNELAEQCAASNVPLPPKQTAK